MKVFNQVFVRVSPSFFLTCDVSMLLLLFSSSESHMQQQQENILLVSKYNASISKYKEKADVSRETERQTQKTEITYPNVLDKMARNNKEDAPTTSSYCAAAWSRDHATFEGQPPPHTPSLHNKRVTPPWARTNKETHIL